MGLRRIGRLLGLLLLAGLSAGLSAAEACPDGRNLEASLARAFLDAMLEEPIERCDPFQDRSGEVQIEGVIRTSARMHVELVPDTDIGRMDVVGQGVFDVSSTVRYRSLTLGLDDII